MTMSTPQSSIAKRRARTGTLVGVHRFGGRTPNEKPDSEPLRSGERVG